MPRLALAGAFLDGECSSTPIQLDFIFRFRAGLTPSLTNDCKKAAIAPPSAHYQGGKTMAIKIDDILMLFCVSGFFAGVAVAVTTLPV
jgi:hypothetical protein